LLIAILLQISLPYYLFLFTISHFFFAACFCNLFVDCASQNDG
jgi:hypothetical protein